MLQLFGTLTRRHSHGYSQRWQPKANAHSLCGCLRTYRANQIQGTREPVRMISYDYVIIGAGSAGCVLAYRLSQNPNTSVLLIEAGPEDTNWLIHMPRGYRRVHRDSRFMWRFPVTADTQREWSGSFTGGKVLGGTSSINSMVYVRGQPQDYDGWAAAGASGWRWDDIAPCFK